jgi:aldehyde dehydrogenase (NAD+)
MVTKIQTASREDVDLAVAAAREAFETTWGTQCSSQLRGRLLFELADKMEAAIDDLAVLETIDSGKPLACESGLRDSRGRITYRECKQGRKSILRTLWLVYDTLREYRIRSKDR